MVMVDYEKNEAGDRVTIFRQTCPWNDIDDDIYELAAMYRHYEKGHLLSSGGLEDQPAWYVEAMDCFTTAMNRWQADSMDRAREKAKAEAKR